MPTVTNPLEPGVYRIDLPCPLAPAFGNWRRAQRGKVHVIELENGPGGTARVSFVVFAKPGAFPFGKLGKPQRGAVVGALPDWPDVVAFVLKPLVPVEEALAAKRWADFFVAHAQPEFAELREAVAVVRANMAVIRSQLEAVKSGTASNPGAVLNNAGAIAKQSIELLLHKAGAIPFAFPRALVNETIEKLQAFADEVGAAPGKALHAISNFAGDAAGVVVPAEIGLGGVALFLAGAYLRYTEHKPSPLSNGLMLAGGAVAVVAGGTLSLNLANLFERIFPFHPEPKP